MSPQTLFAALLIVQTGAKMVWTPGDLPGRRLAIHTRDSHTDSSDPNCIVGGYDDVTQVVHVGGPCSLLDASNTPMEGFRYASMSVIHADFADANGPNAVYTQMYPTSGAIQGQEHSTHVEVGTLGTFGLITPAVQTANAQMFASQTSYLALSTVNFNTVDFVVQDTPSFVTLSVCTQECGTPSGDAAVSCSGCPTTMSSAVPGDYKFSIFAAAYNAYDPTMMLTGWEGLVDAYGTGNPKQLTGVFNVYQYVDFSNMGADNVTIASSGASTLYANMADCSYAAYAACTYYPVTSIALGAAGWEGVEFEFPATYNRGTWNNPTPLQGPSTTTTTVDETKAVTIAALKPDAAWKASIPGAPQKLILLRYTFDVTGITASKDGTSGKWLVYDPSVRTVTAAAARAGSNSGSGSGSTGTTSGCVSHGCFAALLMAVLFMAVKL